MNFFLVELLIIRFVSPQMFNFRFDLDRGMILPPVDHTLLLYMANVDGHLHAFILKTPLSWSVYGINTQN